MDVRKTAPVAEKLTSAEAVEYLRLGNGGDPATVMWRLRHRLHNRLPKSAVSWNGRRLLYLRSALDAWLRAETERRRYA